VLVDRAPQLPLPGGMQPGDLAVWDGHVAAVVGKLLMGFPQKAAGSNPAGAPELSQVRVRFWGPVKVPASPLHLIV
jgi:hypothetical protein